MDRAPVEILDHILEFLRNDPQTLELFSLAWTSPPPIVQQHLFRHVNLVFTSKPPRGCFNLPKLVDILTADPYVGAYIKSIFVSIRRNDIRRWTNGKSTNLLGTEQGLPALPYLGALSITRDKGAGTIPWSRIDKRVRTLLESLASSPSLQSLALLHVQDFPLKTLNNMPNLRSLQTYGYFTSTVDPNISESNPQPLDNLSYLSFGPTCQRDIIPWVRNRLPSMNNVTSLDLSANLVYPIRQIFEIFRTSLKELRMDLSKNCLWIMHTVLNSQLTYTNPDYPPLDVPFSLFQTLTKLKLRHINYQSFNIIRNLPCKDPDAGSGIVSTLKEVTIDFKFYMTSLSIPVFFADKDFSPLAHFISLSASAQNDAPKLFLSFAFEEAGVPVPFETVMSHVRNEAPVLSALVEQKKVIVVESLAEDLVFVAERGLP